MPDPFPELTPNVPAGGVSSADVAALKLSEAFKRSIIVSSPDCIKVLDLQGHLLSLEAGHAILGIEDAGPFLNTSWITFWEAQEDRQAAQSAVAAAAAGGEGKFTGFFRTLHGYDKWWNVVITPILDEGSAPTRLLAVSRDVTDQRHLQNQLMARAELLAQADRSKDEFLAMLAHELRNPLAPLRNATAMLASPEASDFERRQAVYVLDRQITNMSRMIDDLLDVSRITEGKIELQKKPVALLTILTAATSAARASCAKNRQKLISQLPAESLFLHADATRLEQVFGNLLGNATKYAGEGARIVLSAAREGDVVAVSVLDNGVGIDPELLPQVFGLFVQASRTLDRAHGGLGIGLTLAQRLVHQHGGTIEARSQGLGKGAEFIVRLPLVAEPPTPEPEPVRVSAPAVSRRILIVDDNTDSASSMAAIQARRGHVARAVFSGPDALTTAAEFLPDVILLDIGLPGMDGFEVARRIRQTPALANILLIAMTGYAQAEDIAEARAAGFDEHLVKPADLAAVAECLATHPRLTGKDALPIHPQTMQAQ